MPEAEARPEGLVEGLSEALGEPLGDPERLLRGAEGEALAEAH